MNLREQDVRVAVPVTAAVHATPPAPALTSPTDVEARLDEALQMTFPASDPISFPRNVEAWQRSARNGTGRLR